MKWDNVDSRSENVLIAPEAIMCHSKCSSSKFIVMCEALGVKELHNGGTRVWFHPDERSQTISMDSHHYLGN